MGSTQSQKLPTSKVPGGSASGAARGSDFLSGSQLTDLSTPPSPPARSLLATPSGNIMRDGLASGGLKLSAPVGPGAPNRPKDVFQVETVLKGSGLLSRAPGTRFGDDTASAIGQGQQRLNRDHGTAVGRRPLKIDSLINPDGPTQTATQGLARQVADQWRGFEQRRKPTPPRPLTTPPPVSAVAMSDMDARIKRLQDTLTADQAAELTRLADGLSKTRTPGAVAGDISEAINTDGLKAVAEFQVVRDRLAKIGTPDQVRALDEAVLGGVSEQQRDQLKTLFLPHNDGFDGETLELSGQRLQDARDGKHAANFVDDKLPEGADAGKDKSDGSRTGGVQGRIDARKRRRIEAERERQRIRDKDLAPRDALNVPLPKSASDAEKEGFVLQSLRTSEYHQNTKGEPELKYIHSDGREVVYDGDTGKIITDPEIKGTYNYGPEPLSWDHIWKDIFPYYGYRRGGNIKTGPRRTRHKK